MNDIAPSSLELKLCVQQLLLEKSHFVDLSHRKIVEQLEASFVHKLTSRTSEIDSIILSELSKLYAAQNQSSPSKSAEKSRGTNSAALQRLISQAMASIRSHQVDELRLSLTSVVPDVTMCTNSGFVATTSFPVVLTLSCQTQFVVDHVVINGFNIGTIDAFVSSSCDPRCLSFTGLAGETSATNDGSEMQQSILKIHRQQTPSKTSSLRLRIGSRNGLLVVLSVRVFGSMQESKPESVACRSTDPSCDFDDPL